MTLNELDGAVNAVKDLPEEKEIAVAGVKTLRAVTSLGRHLDAHQEEVLSSVFGAEVTQQGLEKLQTLSKPEVALLGMTASGSVSSESLKGLKPSSDLFSTNVYTFFDKCPEQIAVDTRAILQRQKIRKELDSLRKQSSGEMVRIDLSGKTATEITKINQELNAKAARRNENEREFSSNPVIASLDSVASVVTKTTGTVEKGVSGIAGFVKENPGTSIAGALGGAAILKMFSDGIDISDFVLIGAILFVGSTWMYSSHPDKFNEIAGHFGIAQYFNKAPNSPMWAGVNKKPPPSLDFVDSTIAGNEPLSKFGDVSADSAGGVTTTDSQQLQKINENIKALAQCGTNATACKTQSRSLTGA